MNNKEQSEYDLAIRFDKEFPFKLPETLNAPYIPFCIPDLNTRIKLLTFISQERDKVREETTKCHERNLFSHRNKHCKCFNN